MEEKKNQERSFELRSEKVRSIVGQMPSALMRYGISTIVIVLLCLSTVAYFLPYKQIYAGSATIHEIPSIATDSIDVTILLKFEGKQPNLILRQPLYLQTHNNTFSGKILYLSPIRDTLERQVAICRFSTLSIKAVEKQTVDFRTTQSSRNYLHKMLSSFAPK